MKILYRYDDCKHEFTLTKMIQKQYNNGKIISCPKCGKKDIYDTGEKVK